MFGYCDFLAGCIGGACGILIGHPLDTIKTWQQASNLRITTTIYQIVVRNNGVGSDEPMLNFLNGFYRGMMFPLCTSGTLNSILFGLYGNQVRFLQGNCRDDNERNDKWRQHVFMSGSIAGLIHSFIACPSELVKIRLQTQNCKTFCILPKNSLFFYSEGYTTVNKARGPVQCIRSIYREAGILGFYRGMVPMICRDVFPYGIYMLTYEHVTNKLGNLNIVREKRHQLNDSQFDMMVTVTAGALAGLMSWVLVIPFDVIKTITQAQSSDQHTNMIQLIKLKVKEFGWRILFRGSCMLLFRSIPTNAVTFLAYEFALNKCQLFRA